MRYSASITAGATSSGLAAQAAAAVHDSYLLPLGSWINYGAIDGETCVFFDGDVPQPPNAGGVGRLSIAVDRVDNVCTAYLNGAQFFRMTGSNSLEGEERFKSQSIDYKWSAADRIRIEIYNEPNGQTADTSLGEKCTAENLMQPGCGNPMAIINARIAFLYK